MDEKRHHCTESVCVSVNQLYDQCRDKECLEDLRVYLTEEGQKMLDNAISVRIRDVEVIWAYSDVEPLPFNKGHYTVDIQIFFHVCLEITTGASRPVTLDGLATYGKKVVLFGSEGNVKTFTSAYREDAFDPQLWPKTNLPRAVVELVDPVALSAKIVEGCHCPHTPHTILDAAAVPKSVSGIFDGPLVTDTNRRVVLATLGLFSIVKLERTVQLMIPALDFCVPDKECVSATEDDPCDMFERIAFPVNEFFPPITEGGCCCRERQSEEK